MWRADQLALTDAERNHKRRRSPVDGVENVELAVVEPRTGAQHEVPCQVVTTRLARPDLMPMPTSEMFIRAGAISGQAFK